MVCCSPLLLRTTTMLSLRGWSVSERRTTAKCSPSGPHAAGTGGRKDVLGAELFPVRNKKVPRAHPGHRRICRIIVHPPDESRIRWVQRPSMAADGRDATLAAARAPGDGSSDENASKMRHTTLT